MRPNRSVALIVLAAAGCTPAGHTPPPDPPVLRLEMRVPDFTSHLSYAASELGGEPVDATPVLALFRYNTFAAGIDPAAGAAAMDAGTSLVRVADGQVVDGELRVNWADVVDGVFGTGWLDIEGNRVDGAVGGWSFVPSAPLEPGWHALRIDLSDLIALGQPIAYSEPYTHADGDVLYARFRVDSSASWVHMSVDCARRDAAGPLSVDEQRCLIGGVLSEPAAAEWGLTATMAVRYDGSPAACDATVWDELGFSASCAIPASNDVEIEVTLTSDVVAGPEGETPAVRRAAIRDLLPTGADPDWYAFNALVPVSPRLGLEGP